MGQIWSGGGPLALLGLARPAVGSRVRPASSTEAPCLPCMHLCCLLAPWIRARRARICRGSPPVRTVSSAVGIPATPRARDRGRRAPASEGEAARVLSGRQRGSGGGLPFGYVDGEGFGSGWSWCRCGSGDGDSRVKIWRPRAGKASLFDALVSWMTWVRIRAKALCFGAGDRGAFGCHYLLGGVVVGYPACDWVPGENPSSLVRARQRRRFASLPSWGRCRGAQVSSGCSTVESSSWREASTTSASSGSVGLLSLTSVLVSPSSVLTIRWQERRSTARSERAGGPLRR